MTERSRGLDRYSYARVRFHDTTEKNGPMTPDRAIRYLEGLRNVIHFAEYEASLPTGEMSLHREALVAISHRAWNQGFNVASQAPITRMTLNSPLDITIGIGIVTSAVGGVSFVANKVYDLLARHNQWRRDSADTDLHVEQVEALRDRISPIQSRIYPYPQVEIETLIEGTARGLTMIDSIELESDGR